MGDAKLSLVIEMLVKDLDRDLTPEEVKTLFLEVGEGLKKILPDILAKHKMTVPFRVGTLDIDREKYDDYEKRREESLG